MEGSISTYPFWGVIESGRSGREPRSIFTSVTKRLRPLPESYGYTQPGTDSCSDPCYFFHFLRVALFYLNLRFGKTYPVRATSDRYFRKFPKFIGDLQ